MTDESVITIVGASISILTLVATNYFSNRKLMIQLEEDRKKIESQREQDRLDRIADAKIIQENQKAILEAGDKRKKEIVDQVKQVKTVAVKAALKADEATRVANGFNDKIAQTVEVAKETLEKLNNPNA